MVEKRIFSTSFEQFFQILLRVPLNVWAIDDNGDDVFQFGIVLVQPSHHAIVRIITVGTTKKRSNQRFDVVEEFVLDVCCEAR